MVGCYGAAGIDLSLQVVACDIPFISHVNAPRESQYCATSSHEQSDSDESLEDSGSQWKILKDPQNGFFKGIFSSVSTDGAQMKLMKRKFG